MEKCVFDTPLPIRITVTFLSRKSKFNQFRIKAEPFFFSSRFGTPFMMSRVIWKTCFIQSSLKVLMLIKIPTATKIAFQPLVLCQSERGNRAKFLNRIRISFSFFHFVTVGNISTFAWSNTGDQMHRIQD